MYCIIGFIVLTIVGLIVSVLFGKRRRVAKFTFLLNKQNDEYEKKSEAFKKHNDDLKKGKV